LRNNQQGPGIARACSRGLGRDVRFLDCQPEEFRRLLESEGMPGWQAKGVNELMEMIATDRLADITNRGFFEELTRSRGLTVEEFFG
jgi:hypothetical protein